MAEAIPHGYEADDDGEGSSDRKHSNDKRAVRPPLISGGDTPLKRHEGLLRPLGESADAKGESIFRGSETPRADGMAPHAHEVHDRADQGRESERQTHGVSESGASQPERPESHGNSELVAMSPEEFAGLAATEAQAQLQAQEAMRREIAESEEDDDEDEDKPREKPAAKQVAADEPTPSPEPELTAPSEPEPVAPESFDDMLAQEMPAEFAESTSDTHLTNEAVPDLAPATETSAEMPAIEQFDAARESEPHVTREAEVHDFQNFVQQHPELGDLATPLSAESLAAAAASAGEEDNPSDDEIFRDTIRNETGEDPGRARFYDSEPGEPPIDAGGGGENVPPFMPTAEGGAWGGGDGANPNRARMPFGAGIDPVTWAGVAGLGMRERFHNMQHRMAEVGLLGGELLLAAGVIGEHFRAKHQENELRKQGKQLAESVGQTNQALQQERTRHTQTRSQLESLASTQSATSEQLRKAQGGELPVAEAFAGAGLLSAAAAAELAAKTGQTVGGQQSQAEANRELAHQLRNSRELGRAIERNPELRDALAAGGGTEIAGAPESEQQRVHELRELVGSSSYADIVRRERNYEYLHGQSNDDAGQGSQNQSGAGADVHGASGLPVPQPAAGAVSAPIQLIDQTPDQRSANSAKNSTLTKPVAAATVLFIIGIIIIVMVSR